MHKLLSFGTLFLLSAFAGAAVQHSEPAARSPRELDRLLRQTSRDTLQGRWDAAARQVQAGIRAAQASADKESEARLTVELARILADRNFFYKRDPQPALEATRKARELARQTGNRRLLAASLYLLGNVYYAERLVGTGDWKKPRHFLLQALEIQREVADGRGAAFTLFYLGLTAQMQHQEAPARQYLKESLALARQEDDQVLESYGERHLGYLEEVAGRFPAARRHYQRSLKLRQKAEFTVGVPFAMNLLAGFMARHEEKSGEAMTLLGQSIELARRNNSPRARFLGELALGGLALQADRFEEARLHTRRALEEAREFGHAEAAREARLQLQKIEESAARQQ